MNTGCIRFVTGSGKNESMYQHVLPSTDSQYSNMISADKYYLAFLVRTRLSIPGFFSHYMYLILYLWPRTGLYRLLEFSVISNQSAGLPVKARTEHHQL